MDGWTDKGRERQMDRHQGQHSRQAPAQSPSLYLHPETFPTSRLLPVPLPTCPETPLASQQVGFSLCCPTPKEVYSKRKAASWVTLKSSIGQVRAVLSTAGSFRPKAEGCTEG